MPAVFFYQFRLKLAGRGNLAARAYVGERYAAANQSGRVLEIEGVTFRGFRGEVDYPAMVTILKITDEFDQI